MTPGIERFETAVRGVWGAWPSPPSQWSYSSLRAAEECPRRWMLSRASYPALWEGPGYPPLPTFAVLVGNVVHNGLELILRRVYAEGCESLADASAIAVMKELGGYTRLVEKMIEEQMDAFGGNPRVAGRIASIRAALVKGIPDMRQRLQAVLSRMTITPSEAPRASAEGTEGRSPLGPGSHPEVELRAEAVRFVGRADLVTVRAGGCVMTDYKTGAPDEHHVEQLRTYALLWTADADVNPKGLPVQKLVLSYPTHDQTLDPPSEDELAEDLERLKQRIVEAEGKLSLRPPPAYPAEELCRYCPVRQICDDYWASVATRALPGDPAVAGGFVDCEAAIQSRNGPRSWIVTAEPEESKALLRTIDEAPAFSAGDRVRMLGLLLGRDEESGSVTLTMTPGSEIFVLRDGG